MHRVHWRLELILVLTSSFFGFNGLIFVLKACGLDDSGQRERNCLDYETQTSYALTYTATDGGGQAGGLSIPLISPFRLSVETFALCCGGPLGFYPQKCITM